MPLVTHVLEPVWNADSRVLILGTIPSPKSRELGFDSGHPQNRFWPVLSQVLGRPLPQTNEEKRQLCLENGVALWDVLASCDIQGASDSSIRNAKVNDFSHILAHSAVAAIFTTGQTAHRYYQKRCAARYAVPEFCLPSTSPANCQISLPQLVERYRVLLPYLKPASHPSQHSIK